MARKDMTYEEALHAMQSGVAMEHSLKGMSDASPKQIRVGINSAMVNDCALVRILIDKGLLTEAEYTEAVRREMILEVERYEARLSAQTGSQVTLW